MRHGEPARSACGRGVCRPGRGGNEAGETDAGGTDAGGTNAGATEAGGGGVLVTGADCAGCLNHATPLWRAGVRAAWLALVQPPSKHVTAARATIWRARCPLDSRILALIAGNHNATGIEHSGPVEDGRGQQGPDCFASTVSSSGVPGEPQRTRCVNALRATVELRTELPSRSKGDSRGQERRSQRRRRSPALLRPGRHRWAARADPRRCAGGSDQFETAEQGTGRVRRRPGQRRPVVPDCRPAIAAGELGPARSHAEPVDEIGAGVCIAAGRINSTTANPGQRSALRASQGAADPRAVSCSTRASRSASRCRPLSGCCSR